MRRFIPPRTSIRIHTYSIHRDPRNFSPHPEAFWPERWLIAEDPASYAPYKGSSETFIHNPNAYIPFSFGPANCVAKNLALKQMRMVLCHLLQRVTVTFASDYVTSQWDEDMKDHSVFHVETLPVVVTPRDP